jgi:tRNA(Ile)-lysidine synthase
MRKRAASLRAIHIDHGLQGASAQFVEFCTLLCGRLKIPLTVLRVRIRGARGDSLEATARTARYRAFAAELQPQETLLLAHHADDQLETVLLQLLRGAGVAGLAAMPERARCGRGSIVRPLLPLARSALRAFVAAEGIEVCTDPMNSDLRFDRSFLRLEILPPLVARWPGAATAVGRSARHAAEARRLLDALGERDLAQIRDAKALSVPGLRALAPERRRNALRVFIDSLGLPVPDTARLGELAGPFLDARMDACPLVQWKGVVARRHAQRLEILPADAPSVAAPRARRAGALGQAPVVWDWRARRELLLEAVGGVLRLQDDAHGPLDLASLPSPLRIDWRRGGEKLRPRRGGPTRTLKALLQGAGLSHRERAQLPLIYDGERLIAVGDRWSDVSVQASPSSALRGRLSWGVIPRGHLAMC